MVFPVVMYGCESWATMKAEHQRTDAFQLWSWWRLLRVPWTARGSNQSILKEINPEYSLKDWCGNSNTLATWCKKPTYWEKTLMLEKIEGSRRRGWQRMRRLDGITDSMNMNLSKFQDIVKDGKVWHAAVHRVAESGITEQLNKNKQGDPGADESGNTQEALSIYFVSY